MHDIILTPCSQLSGVGKETSKRLAKLNIYNFRDLLFHLPHRYEDRTKVCNIKDLKEGEAALISGQIINVTNPKGGKTRILCQIENDTGAIAVRFFYMNFHQAKALTTGTRIWCFGEAKQNNRGEFEMMHPEYKLMEEGEEPPVEGHLTPVYPLTDGVSQNLMRKIISHVLVMLRAGNLLKELLPEGKYTLSKALEVLHSPLPNENVIDILSGKHEAFRRVVFEELLSQRLSLINIRKKSQAKPAITIDISKAKDLYKNLKNNLPFKLTGAQLKVIEEINNDLQGAQAMQRLVQGDVGSGKTLVAAFAALSAMSNGCQVVVMAPTELLAQQHYKNFSNWVSMVNANDSKNQDALYNSAISKNHSKQEGKIFEDKRCDEIGGGLESHRCDERGGMRNLEVTYLSGAIQGEERKQALADIASGQANIVIGTHALFQKEVIFNNLALLIVDEQHRFGVGQRLLLQQKAVENSPHQLVMSATPIPRTLAMTAFADLDVSVIDELPPGRKPITTVAIDNSRRDNVIERISQVCQTGQQVYWVCTLIEDKSSTYEVIENVNIINSNLNASTRDELNKPSSEEVYSSGGSSEVLDIEAGLGSVSAVESAYKKLKDKLPDISIAMVHGRSDDKDQIMQDFKNNKYQILVATTVIEVGVDVPNANLMIIENPERLGLSQLHQLRGRVGRGDKDSYCILLYQSPLTEEGHARIEIMRETQDGFEVAARDLQLRGVGEFLGARQSGHSNLRIADPLRDIDLLPEIKLSSDVIIQHHSENIDAIIRRWEFNAPVAVQ